MRKIIIFASVSILVLLLVMLVAGFTVKTPDSKGGAAPLRIDLGTAKKVPAGYRRVFVKPGSEERAKVLWQRSFGNLDGYSFEKAGTINLVVPEGSEAPCACHLEGMPYVYIYRTKENGGSTCEDSCRPISD